MQKPEIGNSWVWGDGSEFQASLEYTASFFLKDSNIVYGFGLKKNLKIYLYGTTFLVIIFM